MDKGKIIQNLIGRSKEKEQINKILKESKSNMIIISGPTGVGKTELVLGYLEQYKNNYSEVKQVNATITLQDASSKSSRKISLKKIVRIASEIGRKDKLKRNILVIDDLKDRSQLEDVLYKYNNYHATIAMTTNCDEEEWSNFEVLNVDILSKMDAERLVENLLELETEVKLQREDVEKLVKTMKQYPQALQQAISYILRKKITIQEYLSEFENNPEAMFNQKSTDDESEIRFFSSLRQTLSDLKSENNTLEVFCILSMLVPRKIPIECVYAMDVSGERMEDVLKKLKKNSLVRKEGTFLYVHVFAKLICTRILRKDADFEFFKKISSFCSKIGEKIDFSATGIELAFDVLPCINFFKSHLDELCKHSKNNEFVNLIKQNCLYEILICLSQLYHVTGDYQNMKITLEAICSIAKVKYQDENSQKIEVNRISSELAHVYYLLKDYKTANILFKRVLPIFKGAMVPECSEMIELLLNYADNLRCLNKFSEANAIYEETKIAIEKNPAACEVQKAHLYQSWAINKSKQGNHESANSMFALSHTKFVSVLGEDHIFVAHLMKCWAEHEVAKENFELAKEKYQICFFIYKRIYKDGHQLVESVGDEIEKSNRSVEVAGMSVQQEPDINSQNPYIDCDNNNSEYQDLMSILNDMNNSINMHFNEIKLRFEENVFGEDQNVQSCDSFLTKFTKLEIDVSNKFKMMQSSIGEHKMKLQEAADNKFIVQYEEVMSWIKTRKSLVKSDEYGNNAESVTHLINSLDEIKKEVKDYENNYKAILEYGNNISIVDLSKKDDINKKIWKLEEKWDGLKKTLGSRESYLKSALDYYNLYNKTWKLISTFVERYSQEFSDLSMFGNDLRSIEILLQKYDFMRKKSEPVRQEIEVFKSEADNMITTTPKFNDSVTIIQEKMIKPFMEILEDVSIKKEQIMSAKIFFEKLTSLRSWMKDMLRNIDKLELPTEIKSAQVLMKNFKGIKDSIEFKKDDFFQLYELAENMLKNNHFMMEGIQNSRDSIQSNYESLNSLCVERDNLYKKIHAIYLQPEKLFGFSLTEIEPEINDYIKKMDMDGDKKITKVIEYFVKKQSQLENEMKKDIENSEKSNISIKALKDILVDNMNSYFKLLETKAITPTLEKNQVDINDNSPGDIHTQENYSNSFNSNFGKSNFVLLGYLVVFLTYVVYRIIDYSLSRSTPTE